MAAGLLTVFAVVLGLGLTVAGSASATTLPGTWHPYGNTNPITSKWHCGSTSNLAGGIKAQVCDIRSTDGVSIQAAAIVRNNNSTTASATAKLYFSTHGGSAYEDNWQCKPSGVAANSWSVCFGRTINFQSNPGNNVWTDGTVNGVRLGSSER